MSNQHSSSAFTNLPKIVSSVIALSFSAQIVAQQDIRVNESWERISRERLTSIEQSITTITQQVTRLENANTQAQMEMARVDNPECVDVLCDDLDRLYYLVSKAELEADTGVRVAKLAVQNWDKFYRDSSASIPAIQSGADSLANTLFYQNIALTVAEVAALFATGGSSATIRFTGSATEIGRHIAERELTRLATTVANYGLNRLAGTVTDFSSDFADDMGELGTEPISQSMLSSLGTQLTRVALVKSDAPGTFAWTMDPIALITDKQRAVSMGVQVLIDTITEPFIGETNRQLTQAQQDLKTSLNQQDAVLRTLAHTRVAAVEASRHRIAIVDLKRRIESLREDCNRQAAGHSCNLEYQTAIREAEDSFNTAVTDAKNENELTASQLFVMRQSQDSAFQRAVQAHQSLRGARDQQSSTTQATTNRALIEELARNASDPAVRQRYQEQLDALNNNTSPGEQAAEVARLEQEREEAWREVEQLNDQIRQASQEALEIYRRNDAAIEEAEISYIRALSDIEQMQLDCLEAMRPPDLAPIPRNNELLTRGGTYGPDEIFLPIAQTLELLDASSRNARIELEIREDGECAINYELSGCFQTDNPMTAMDLLLETDLQRARATLMPSNDPFLGRSLAGDFLLPQVFTGSLAEGEANLVHRYTETDRELLRALIATDNDDAVIDILLREGAQATISGSITNDAQVLNLPGQPFGSMPDSGITTDVMNLSIRFLNFDLQPALYFDNSLGCPVGDSFLVGDSVCVVQSDTERNPGFFDFTAMMLEEQLSWLEIGNVAQFAENPMIFSEPFSPNAAMGTMFELGDSVWVETQANTFACDFQQESLLVRVEPENNPGSGFSIELLETTPNSGIFRSDNDGIPLDFDASDVFAGPSGNILFRIEERQDSSQSYNFISIIR